MRQEILQLQLSFHVRLPEAAPPEFLSLAPVLVQREQCQSNVSLVPVQDSTVPKEFVCPTSVFLQNVRSAKAVSEEIANAVSTSESATLKVRPLPCRSKLPSVKKQDADQSSSSETVLNSVCLSRVARV